MKKNIISLIIYIVMTNMLFNCQKSKNMTGTYSYETGSGCADNYPIETYQQALYSADNTLIPIDGLGVLRGPWGDGGVNYVKNQEGGYKLPTTLKVGYYSYTEDKFYEGEFPLPTEKIKEYLEQKSENPEYKNDAEAIHHKYNRIELGCTLGGMVAFWIKGEADQILLATFKAKESSSDWKTVFGNTSREEEVNDRLNSDMYTPSVKGEIKHKKLPLNRWTQYNEKSDWSLKLNLPNNATLDRLYIKMINAESFTDYNIINLSKNEPKALPYNIEFFWTLNGKKYNSRVIFGNQPNYYNTIYKASLIKQNEDKYPVDFTKEEVYALFHQISSSAKKDLKINVDDEQKITLKLKSVDKELLFKNIIAKTFAQ